MFIESPRFPDSISKGSRGGPQYKSIIIKSDSGYEQRNICWEMPLHRYDISFGIDSLSDLEKVLEFFHAARGKAYGFRFKDWADYKSCSVLSDISGEDQLIGIGDGATTSFQLVKRYKVGTVELIRTIKKPVEGSVVVTIDGVEISTDQYSVDYTTGIITFSSPPTNNAVIKAGFEFDVPVRFDTDYLPTRLESFMYGQMELTLVEIRL